MLRIIKVQGNHYTDLYQGPGQAIRYKISLDAFTYQNNIIGRFYQRF